MEKQKGCIVVIGNTTGAFMESFKIWHDLFLLSLIIYSALICSLYDGFWHFELGADIVESHKYS